MKIRLLLMVFGLLAVFALSGCGSPKAEASPSDSPDTVPNAETTLVTGIVAFVDEESITLALAPREDAPVVGTSQAYAVDSATYVKSDETIMIDTDDATIVVLEYQGYTANSPDIITEGDFLAVVLRGGTAAVIIDRGPAKDYETDVTAGDPTDEPEDPDASPSKGVPDSGESITYSVTTDNLKVRSGPGTTSTVLGIIDTGARVTGTVTEGWLEFTYDGTKAYCSAEFLAVSTAPFGVPDSSVSKTYTTTSKLTIRTGPGTSYSSAGTLEKGTKITGTILCGWIKFEYDNKPAYCSASYLTED